MYSTKLKYKKLHEALSHMENEFPNPKVKLEQYATDVQTSAELIHLAQSQYGDIEGKMVADFGCGVGVLSIGAALLGASYVLGMDIDQEALEICTENVDIFDLDNIDLLLCDITRLKEMESTENDASEDNEHYKQQLYTERFSKSFDTVLTNPPFGTKNNEGIDIRFLKRALSVARCAVYSFHKSSTRSYIEKKAKEWNVGMTVLGKVRFLIPQVYKFHKHKEVDIEVDFIRFYHK